MREIGISMSLDEVFNPCSVVVVGASPDERKMGHQCVKSLVEAFDGEIYVVNPHASRILGINSYKSVRQIPGSVDLAIVVVPSSVVLSAVRECAEKGVKGAVIITGGFKEASAAERDVDTGGELLQEQLAALAEEAGMRIIGPNTFGFVNVGVINASFSPVFNGLRKGRIAMVGQSGGVCHIFAYMAMNEGVGLNKLVGLGNRCNVEFYDILEYLEEDDETDTIAMHIEGIDEPRKLMNAARRVAKKKPVVAYKVGRTRAVERAALSHTGSMAGEYKLYDAAFRQSGVVTVNSCEELFDAAKILSLCQDCLPKGRKVAIISTQAGPGIILTDECTSGGLQLARFSEATEKKLKRLLPPLTIRENPVDMAFIRDAGLWLEVVRTVLADDGVDALIIFNLYHPSFLLPPEEIVDARRCYGKPLIMCTSFPHELMLKEKIKLEEEGVPVYSTPERGAKALITLIKYAEMKRRIESG
ncbi:MAG: Acyl-CoA synthetase [Candidatus Alkanophagales archaeon MCA70_species_2]|nr:Acyl-CoA synthetase [Candidatus Alkanophaga liquidiphilum]